jgi:hypothetical protein
VAVVSAEVAAYGELLVAPEAVVLQVAVLQAVVLRVVVLRVVALPVAEGWG